MTSPAPCPESAKRSLKMYLLWAFVLLLLITGGLSCAPNKTEQASGARSSPAATVREQATLKPGSLPPLRVGAQYKAPPPPDGKSYGLRYLKVREGDETIEPKYMWVHCVKRLVPGATLNGAKVFAGKLGLKYGGVDPTTKAHRFHNASAKGFFSARDGNFRYYSGAWPAPIPCTTLRVSFSPLPLFSD